MDIQDAFIAGDFFEQTLSSSCSSKKIAPKTIK